MTLPGPDYVVFEGMQVFVHLFRIQMSPSVRVIDTTQHAYTKLTFVFPWLSVTVLPGMEVYMVVFFALRKMNGGYIWERMHV